MVSAPSAGQSEADASPEMTPSDQTSLVVLDDPEPSQSRTRICMSYVRCFFRCRIVAAAAPGPAITRGNPAPAFFGVVSASASLDPTRDLHVRLRLPAAAWFALLDRRFVLRFGSCVERAARLPCLHTRFACPAGLLVHHPSPPCRVRNGIDGDCRRCPIGTPQRRPGGRQRRLWRHRTAAQRSTARNQRHATGPTIRLAACAANPRCDCASGLPLRPVTTGFPHRAACSAIRLRLVRRPAVVTGRSPMQSPQARSQRLSAGSMLSYRTSMSAAAQNSRPS